MRQINPVSEEFMYCDPECIHESMEACQEAHPCHLCYVADKLAASDSEIKELRYEC